MHRNGTGYFPSFFNIYIDELAIQYEKIISLKFKKYKIKWFS